MSEFDWFIGIGSIVVFLVAGGGLLRYLNKEDRSATVFYITVIALLIGTYYTYRILVLLLKKAGT
jgi:hypothetical protein